MTPSQFDFDCITRTRYYKRHMENCLKHNYTRDICDKSFNDLHIDRSKYINVVQKSPLWLKLRALSNGTASSLGKYIMGDKWTSEDQLNENWYNKIEQPITQMMEAHMKWGTTYEDLALICFAEQYDVCALQVGTLRVDYFDIHENYKLFFPFLPDLKIEDNSNFHLLISPDGIVTNHKNKKIGMLEIKCMSPFYHLENENNNIIWSHNMENRQWTTVDKIPHVYFIQMCLQALSGIIELEMDLKDTMYFERWSPKGFSIFEIPFQELFMIGILVSELYFSILQRTKNNKKAYPLNEEETQVYSHITKLKKIIFKKIKHKYYDIRDKHPYYDLFQNYYFVTKYSEFTMKKEVKSQCLI